ncbi:MAG TPA: hypothetical protein VFM53_14805, partial [Anaeromyxobacteraceae bacterium]|nr:hypothetical protein [Anaeromyxobacteraceae bacterium]
HHGLGRSRGDVLFIAQALAGNGMAVVAVDAAKHGARAWCTKNTQTGVSTGCATGSTCDTTPFAQQPGDPATARPGLCTGGNLALLPIGCDPTTQPTCWNGAQGNSATSGAFVISGNLFRSRDTVRQDILDQSMVVRVMTSQAGQAALASVAGAPFLLDPTKVYYVGQSLGAIEGTLDVAANPRISKAVLNVGGATILDILTTSPSPGVGGAFLAALASLGITPGTEQFLLFTIAAKWILDPADPANFAQNLVAAPLPNLLVDPTGQTPQAAKAVLGQAARCDGTVPNPTNQLLYGLVGLHPIAPLTADPAPSLQWFMSSSSAGACPVGAASHGFLLDWSVPAMATAGQANVVAYLLGGPVSPSPVVVP